MKLIFLLALYINITNFLLCIWIKFELIFVESDEESADEDFDKLIKDLFGDQIDENKIEELSESKIENEKSEDRMMDLMTIKQAISENIDKFDIEEFWKTKCGNEPYIKPIESGLSNSKHQMVNYIFGKLVESLNIILL